ncbi:MAG TPA: hypothetical protein VJ890_21145 [Vineibacter sp.]|nr:hypothetical protein [Vineibacter sp.]
MDGFALFARIAAWRAQRSFGRALGADSLGWSGLPLGVLPLGLTNTPQTSAAPPGDDSMIQLSTSVRNARLDAIETTVGVSAILKIRTGAAPANCAAADTGTVLATLNLPSDWMAAAASGSKAKSGTWEDTSADGTGTAAHFRLYASDGTTCHMQGTVTVTGGGGDLTVDNVSFSAGQSFTITGFSLTDGNA